MGSAAAPLPRHLGDGQADAIAIGGVKTGIPMFEACAFSVCMGSGAPEAKAAAGFAAGDVDKDGLYKAFARLGLL